MRLSIRLVFVVLLLGYLALGLGEVALSSLLGLNRELLGMAFLVPAVAAVVLAKRANMLRPPLQSYPGVDLRVSFSIWLILFTAAIVVYPFSLPDYHISLAFMLLLCAAAITTVYQIFQSAISPGRTFLILGEVVAIGLMVTYAFQFQFPGPIGNDSTYHIGMVDSIISSGHTGGYPGQYGDYPIYQILLAQIDLLTDAGAKMSIAILGLSEIPFLLMIFLIVDRIFDRRAALTASLLAAFAPHILQAWYMYYPNSFTVLFFVICIFLSLRYPASNATKALLVLVFLVILVTHPLTPAILLLFMALFLVGAQFIVKTGLNLSWKILAGLAAVTVAQWGLTGSEGEATLLSTLLSTIKGIFENEVSNTVSGTTMSASYPLLDVVLYDLGLAILILASAWGAFIILQWMRGAGKDSSFLDIKRALLLSQASGDPLLTDVKLALLLSVTTLCTIPIPYIFAAAYPSSQPDRWFPFIETLMCMIGGFVLALFIRNGRRRSRTAWGAAAIFLLIFMMVSSPQANVTNDIYSGSLSNRNSLTLSEDSGRAFIVDQSIPELHASSVYYQFINRTLINTKDYFDASYERYILNPNDTLTYSYGSVAVRQYDLEKGFTIAYYGREGKLAEIHYPNDQFNTTLARMNNVYSSQSVNIYMAG